MINSLKLKNFKAFEDQLLDLKNLTLLSGLNSTGKSSTLQALLLLRQSYLQDLLPDKGLALNGEFVSIGTAQDALFEGAKDDSIGFELMWTNGTHGIWLFNYNQEADVLALASELTSSNIYQLSLFNDKFHYLQAERIGTRTYFEISDFQVRQHKQLGTKGEYTAHFLSIYRDQDIPNANLSHPSATSLNLRDQVEAWLGEISPGTRLEIKSNSDMDLVSFQYTYGLSNPYRATNVGFGITYTLPIIVAVLASEPDTLILVENPEAHLHPRGQAKMGELLALAASCGVQVVIETHSDHVLNGIRLAVHDGKLEPEDVQLHYFQRQEKQGQAYTKVVSPHIDRDGRIDRWPDGFFDEWEKSLDALLEPVMGD
ncbi:DUF3696 domain-containing protein [Calothrix sp. FACHB-1219]|uniref:AAA family ATPase n=1 Tax=unclassified Calothrix TaxID=2619626 RepID=UPI0016871DF7|nr:MULTISPECIES: DUF3696 domain-containing protein [unclassified Calothrix]MBD2206194.1 DUF3696 domain-containing protein [Calothrix sp. FACHB-168]MBD2221039.1 DUF3696 domain-containing protein [Calothrix sp. FACHB-1219]